MPTAPRTPLLTISQRHRHNAGTDACRSNTVLELATAHAIRASLLARAHATTLECRRVSIARTQSTTRPDCLSSRSISARGTLDQQVANILVPSLGDSEQVRSTACTVLLWYQPYCGGKVSAASV